MIRYRTATADEVGLVLDWAAAEGWNPGLDDAAAFHAADPGGFFLALDGDAPVAAVSVVNHTDAFAFLGLYICRPERRGEGIGFGLWRHAMAHAGDRTVGLDGVPEQQQNYARSGFVRTGETTRFTGVLPAAPHAEVRPAAPEDVAALIGLEAQASGVRKERYLVPWLTGSVTRRTAVLTDAGGVRGGMTLRRCRSGYKIGPLTADGPETARALLGYAARAAGGAEVSIDVPESSAALAGICGEIGMAPGFRTARMYRGAVPGTSRPYFAVTTLELG